MSEKLNEQIKEAVTIYLSLDEETKDSVVTLLKSVGKSPCQHPSHSETG